MRDTRKICPFGTYYMMKGGSIDSKIKMNKIFNLTSAMRRIRLIITMSLKVRAVFPLKLN